MELERDVFGAETTSGSESDVETFLRYYTDFGRLGTSAYTWNTELPEPRKLFIEGKLGMMLDYASYAPELQKQNHSI